MRSLSLEICNGPFNWIGVRLMTLARFARLRPFLWLGAFTILLMLTGRFIPLNYDQGPVGFGWFAFSYALTFVFRASSGVVSALFGGQTGSAAAAASLILGSVVYVLADRLLLVIVRKRSS